MNIEEFVRFVVSIVFAAVTGYIAAQQAYKGEIKKSIYEKREKLYVDLFTLLDSLQRNPGIMYNYSKFITEYKQIRAKSYLYASDEVLRLLIPFNDKLSHYWQTYEKLYSDNEINREIDKRLYEAEENGQTFIRDEIEYILNQEEERFIEENQLSIGSIQEIMQDLSLQIRKELKSK